MKLPKDKILLAIAVTVTVIWVITILVQVITGNEAPDSVNKVMIIVAGGLFVASKATNGSTKNES